MLHAHIQHIRRIPCYSTQEPRKARYQYQNANTRLRICGFASKSLFQCLVHPEARRTIRPLTQHRGGEAFVESAHPVGAEDVAEHLRHAEAVGAMMWLCLKADFDEVEGMCYAGREAGCGAAEPFYFVNQVTFVFACILILYQKG